MKDLVIKMFMGTLTEAEKQYLIILLGKAKEGNTPEQYAQFLKGGHAFLTVLGKLAEKTKTHIDDDVVAADLSAIEELAAADGITF
jgi:protoporphyrinogen oxidase